MFTFTQIKYLHIPLLAKIFGEEILCKKNSSLANQNVEEINIAGKYLSGRRNYIIRNNHLSTHR